MIKRNSSYNSKYLLYLVATPIGNLDDITFRSLKILNEADIIACEDTRNSAKLLNYFNIKNKKLVSIHEHNESSNSLQIIEQIKVGKKVCYISDAGYPLISDPGFILAKLCLENDIAISVIPGANALLNGLIGSNLPSDHFYFYGFLNSNKVKRKKQLESLKDFKETIIFYEAPHRIKDTLEDIKTVFKDDERKITIARELTKIHEEYIYMQLKDIDNLDYTTLKGEMVIIIEGNKNDDIKINHDELINEIKSLLKDEKLKNNEIAKSLSIKYHISKNEIYDLILSIKS